MIAAQKNKKASAPRGATPSNYLPQTPHLFLPRAGAYPGQPGSPGSPLEESSAGGLGSTLADRRACEA